MNTARRDYIIGIIRDMAGCDIPAAEMLVDRLTEEGVLVLGYGDKEVETITEAFKTIYGTTKTSKYDRWAAHRLAGGYGAQAVVGIIKLLNSSQDKYAPVPKSVTDLEEKWASVLSFLRKQTGDETIKV